MAYNQDAAALAEIRKRGAEGEGKDKDKDGQNDEFKKRWVWMWTFLVMVLTVLQIRQLGLPTLASSRRMQSQTLPRCRLSRMHSRVVWRPLAGFVDSCVEF